MTITQRHDAIAEANRQQDMAEHFRGRGDIASAEKAEAKAAALRASLR